MTGSIGLAGDAAPERPIEIELKYRLADLATGEPFLDAERLGPFQPLGPAVEARIADRYLDTLDRRLRVAGHGARIRLEDGVATLTVKSGARRAGPARPVTREELEGPADPILPPEAWPSSSARDRLLALAAGAPLVEVVTLRQVRRRRILEAPPGTRVELSLDDVEVVFDGRVIRRFAELEVELLAGPEEPLHDLGEILAAEPGLDAASAAKLTTALRAIEELAS